MPLLSPLWRQFRAELAPFDKVSEGYTKLAVNDQKNPKGLFTLWKRDKDAQLLGELPKNFMGKNYFIALTVSSGDKYAGLQSGDWVVQWRRYGDRLALIAPNLDIRATGDAESKASVKRLFTDRVLLDVSILALGPTGGPSHRHGLTVDWQRESLLWLLGSDQQFKNHEIGFREGFPKQR